MLLPWTTAAGTWQAPSWCTAACTSACLVAGGALSCGMHGRVHGQMGEQLSYLTILAVSHLSGLVRLIIGSGLGYSSTHRGACSSWSAQE